MPTPDDILARNQTPPVIADRLPSDLTLHLAHWALNLALKGGRTVEEARSVEAMAWAQLGEGRTA